VFLAALAALIELQVANFGLYVLTLLAPVLGGLAVYPQWRRPLSIVLGGLVAVMLTPAVLFFAYWVMWGAAAGVGREAPGAGRFGLMMFVMTASIVAVFVPVLVGMMMPLLVGHHADHGLRESTQAIHRAGRATRGFAQTQSARMQRLGTTRGLAGGGWARPETAPIRTRGSTSRNGAPLAPRAGGQREPGGGGRREANTTKAGMEPAQKPAPNQGSTGTPSARAGGESPMQRRRDVGADDPRTERGQQ
jgi:hypothetical protein